MVVGQDAFTFQETPSFLEGEALLHVLDAVLVGLWGGKVVPYQFPVDEFSGTFVDPFQVIGEGPRLWFVRQAVMDGVQMDVAAEVHKEVVGVHGECFVGAFEQCAAVFIAATTSFASAQTNRGPLQGTQTEQNACQRDAVRFCKDAVPDTFRVLACLQTNRTKISKGCRLVLESHGQ